MEGQCELTPPPRTILEKWGHFGSHVERLLGRGGECRGARGVLKAVLSEEECMGREERRREATLLIQATYRHQ